MLVRFVVHDWSENYFSCSFSFASSASLSRDVQFYDFTCTLSDQFATHAEESLGKRLFRIHIDQTEHGKATGRRKVSNSLLTESI